MSNSWSNRKVLAYALTILSTMLTIILIIQVCNDFNSDNFFVNLSTLVLLIFVILLWFIFLMNYLLNKKNETFYIDYGIMV